MLLSSSTVVLLSLVSVSLFVFLVQLFSPHRFAVYRRSLGGILATFLILSSYSTALNHVNFFNLLLSTIQSSFRLSSIFIPVFITSIPYFPDLIVYISQCVGTGKLKFINFLSFKSLYPLILRNVVFAPILEELSFRLPFLVIFNSKLITSRSFLIILSSVPFSVAHFHHFLFPLLRSFVFGGRYSPGMTLSSAFFQLCYTFIFGVYVSFVCFKYGIFGAILTHSVANFGSIPSSFLLNKFYFFLFIICLSVWLLFVIYCLI
ncbi:hypothetical protein P9112_001011 [Eukaryota sp. TZLM1-RC]